MAALFIDNRFVYDSTCNYIFLCKGYNIDRFFILESQCVPLEVLSLVFFRWKSTRTKISPGTWETIYANEFAIFLGWQLLVSVGKSKQSKGNQGNPTYPWVAYPRHPQTPKWKEFLHKLLVGGMGYAPGVCWKVLRNKWSFFKFIKGLRGCLWRWNSILYSSLFTC